MKKLYGLSVSLMLAFVLFLLPTVASAAPTPPLTSLEIVGITSDGYNYEWSNAHLSGTEGVIAVQVRGTIWGSPPKPNIVQDGTIIPTTQALPNDYITDSGNNVIGTIYYRAFDLSDVTSGLLFATAQDYYPPNRTFTDNIAITVEK
ncbi:MULTISPECIES: hypothetical protein [unclassified Paenibacillus]|uniref:hypothetical protein n=1 Tax=unclassified Paenibacillus TaxID=185978 RepID=UPI0024BB9371|nr:MULTISPECIES: hypothetical protein [unclassified Paenibacillus]